MKRLFYLVDLKHRRLRDNANQVIYFETKQEAKQTRNRYNELGGTYHVAPGPDHIGPHGKAPKKWRDRI